MIGTRTTTGTMRITADPISTDILIMSTDIIMGTDIVITGMTFTTASAMFVQRAKASHRIDSN